MSSLLCPPRSASPARRSAPTFEEIHDRYRDFLTQICRRQLHDHEDVQDAMQETWLAAFRHLQLLQRVNALPRLLREIAVNKCRDLHRRRRRRAAQPLDAVPEPAAAGEPANGAHGGTERQDRHHLREQLQRSIDRLSPSLRLVATLRYLDGLSYLEIAAQLSVSEGTVKSRLHRARHRLRHSCGVRALVDHYERFARVAS
jgi:RNA polymerase sigma-70 factor, ECF subfamily